MTNKASTIIVDRLEHALDTQGVKLKRRALLETAAYVFGFRHSNAFTQAASSGEINPPSVVPIGRLTLPDGGTILVVTDPLSNSAYGIDEAFVDQTVEEERRETIGVSPYGHLVRLDALGDATIPDLQTARTAPEVGALRGHIAAAIQHLDGYTAEDDQVDAIGQAENALSRAATHAGSGDAASAKRELGAAREMLDLVTTDDAERHVEWTREDIANALRQTPADGPTAADQGQRALSKILSDILVHVDQEIESRKAGGDPDAWRELSRMSDHAHAALRRLPALTVPAESDPASIRISRDDLRNVIGAAESWAEDLTSGLADGTYDDDAGVDDVEASIETLKLRLDMETVPTTPEPERRVAEGKLLIHMARISHKHGDNQYVSLSRADLERQVADYCRDEWHEVADWDGVPNNPDGMTDVEIADTYFSAMSEHEGREYIDTSEEEIDIPAGMLIAPVPNSAPKSATCARCGGVLRSDGTCPDETCPFHEVRQDDPRGWAGHPEREAQMDLQRIEPSRTRPGAGGLPIDWSDQVADVLENGVSADIWYDAGTFAPAPETPGADRHPDSVAAATIDETQRAMLEAARLLRDLKPVPLDDGAIMVDGRITNRDRVAKRLDAIRSDQPTWMTDSEGESTDLVTISMAAALGLPYRHDREDGLPLTNREYEMLGGGETLNAHLGHPVRLGFSVLWSGRKWLAPEVEFAFPDQGDDFPNGAEAAKKRALDYMDDIRPSVEALGGELHLFEDATDFAHELSILLPFELALESPNVDDWHQALAYLLLSNAEKAARRQIVCEYTAEANFHKYTASVEPLGDTVWDGTFDALRWGTDAAIAILDGETDPDDYARSPLAPEWVRQWSEGHPFSVQLIGLQEALRIAR